MDSEKEEQQVTCNAAVDRGTNTPASEDRPLRTIQRTAF
jgi:hypothetical protein